MKKILLDASALIALIYNEKGASRVEETLNHSEISAVNLSEVIAYMIKKGVDSKEIHQLFEDLAIPIQEFDKEQCFLAGELIEVTMAKGLSFGDRACLALAIQKKYQVLTADKAWSALSLDINIELIR